MAWVEEAAPRTPTNLPWNEGDLVTWPEAVGAWQDGLLNIVWLARVATVGTWAEEAPAA